MTCIAVSCRHERSFTFDPARTALLAIDMQREFFADCCAASEPGMHEAALRIIAGEGHLFGWICDVADLATAVAR